MNTESNRIAQLEQQLEFEKRRNEYLQSLAPTNGNHAFFDPSQHLAANHSCTGDVSQDPVTLARSKSNIGHMSSPGSFVIVSTVSFKILLANCSSRP